jgi:hypothetical protein
VFDNGSVRLKTIDESGVSFVINGHRLKLYNKPISWNDFISQFSQEEEIAVLGKENDTSTPLSSLNDTPTPLSS